MVVHLDESVEMVAPKRKKMIAMEDGGCAWKAQIVPPIFHRRLLLCWVCCCWRLLTTSIKIFICYTSAVIWASVVTTGREKLSSATGGGGGGSFLREECLTEPVEYWALIFDMIDCISLHT